MENMVKSIKMMPTGLKGILLGWSPDLENGRQKFDVILWDPAERRYFETTAHPNELVVDKGPDTFSKSDWERIPPFVEQAMDAALATRDFKWAARLHKLQKHAEKRLAPKPKVVSVKKEKVVKTIQHFAKKEIERLNANGIEVGMDVRHVKVKVRGTVVGFANNPKMAIVSWYDPRHNKYVVKEYHVRFLQPFELDGSEKEVPKQKDPEYIDRLIQTAGEMAVNSHDPQWFQLLSDLKDEIKKEQME